MGTIYPGTCRNGSTTDQPAFRVRTNNDRIAFDDGLQASQTQRLEQESGDFVILRRDGLIAYQLAVVVDDYLQGVTEIVRGIDLLDSTPRQIWLQRLLGYPQPDYLHIPVAIDDQGQKLSKSQGAGAVSLDRKPETLVAALQVLHQSPPPQLATASIDDVWAWAHANWCIDRLRRRTEVPVGHLALANVENRLS